MGNDRSKLSHKLLDFGFFSALGTSQTRCFGVTTETDEELRVKRGKPNTYDSNNGVTVVYDEDGRPWIIRSSHIDKVGMDSLHIAAGEYNMKRGAYVPHSNDGGTFVNEVLPKL